MNARAEHEACPNNPQGLSFEECDNPKCVLAVTRQAIRNYLVAVARAPNNRDEEELRLASEALYRVAQEPGE